jgi:hypothetical protein
MLTYSQRPQGGLYFLDERRLVAKEKATRLSRVGKRVPHGNWMAAFEQCKTPALPFHEEATNHIAKYLPFRRESRVGWFKG